MKAMTSTEERVGPTPQEEKDMSPEEEQQSSIADDLVRRNALHAFIPEPPGGTSTETIDTPALRGSHAASPVSPLPLTPLPFHGFQTEV